MVKTVVCKYSLTMETDVILSPRQAGAFYKVAALDDGEAEKMKEYKIIYPFYQYGEYERYDPDEAQFYIPGSSIKGALTAGDRIDDRKPLALFVDDVRVNHSREIEVRSLAKFQYLASLAEPPTSNKVPSLKPFFDSTMGIQTLKKGTVLHGSLRCTSAEAFQELLKKSEKRYHDKMSRYIKQLLFVQEGLEKYMAEHPNEQKSAEDSLAVVAQIIENCRKYKDGHYMVLGGYKGMIRSLTSGGDNLNSAVFVDKESREPYGIVKIEYIKETEDVKG